MGLTDLRPSGPLPAGLFAARKFNVFASDGFGQWLVDTDVSLVVAAAGALVTIGQAGDGAISTDERFANGPRAIVADGTQTLWWTSGWQLTRHENALATGGHDDRGHDAVYCEQESRNIGAIGPFDAGVDGDGRVLFTSALWNCVATVSDRASFLPVWRPPFVTELADDDRCHLTGLAIDDGELAWVTCAAACNDSYGWTSAIASGGVLVDARSGETVTSGLSVPHSPRVHGERVLVANAGAGELVSVDPANGEHETVAKLPAFLRGLHVVDHWAVVGCSWPLRHGAYAQAPIADAVTDADRVCGIAIVDLDRGDVVHTLWLEGDHGEVLGLTALHGVRRPIASDIVGALNEPMIIGPTELL